MNADEAIRLYKEQKHELTAAEVVEMGMDQYAVYFTRRLGVMTPVERQAFLSDAFNATFNNIEEYARMSSVPGGVMAKLLLKANAKLGRERFVRSSLASVLAGHPQDRANRLAALAANYFAQYANELEAEQAGPGA